jgi:hypothetical protein
MPRRDITADDVIRELLGLSRNGRQTQRIPMTGNSSPSGPPAGGPGTGGGSTGGGGSDPPPTPGSGGGGGDIAVKEGGTSVVGAAESIDFDATYFDVTASGTEADVTFRPSSVAITIEEDDATVLAGARTIDLDGDYFDVTAIGTEANITLRPASVVDYAIIFDDDYNVVHDASGAILHAEEIRTVVWG